MKAPLVAPAAVALALLGSSLPAPCAAADPGAANPAIPAKRTPFVDHTQWVRWQGLPSLRVFPTPSGRAVSRQPGGAEAAAAGAAWAEVLALAPDADTPGMRAQFVCHWQFAERAQPGKTSWNLEPWRPVVDDAQMFATGCNPGGREEGL